MLFLIENRRYRMHPKSVMIGHWLNRWSRFSYFHKRAEIFPIPRLQIGDSNTFLKSEIW